MSVIFTDFCWKKVVLTVGKPFLTCDFHSREIICIPTKNSWRLKKPKSLECLKSQKYQNSLQSLKNSIKKIDNFNQFEHFIESRKFKKPENLKECSVYGVIFFYGIKWYFEDASGLFVSFPKLFPSFTHPPLPILRITIDRKFLLCFWNEIHF